MTGTDTGVGKTLVAAALAAWCRARGVNAGVMKPVATGGQLLGWRLVSDDARDLARASGAGDPWRLVNPVCFREPIAPWAAARRERRPIRLAPIQRAFRTLRRRHEVVIVEGIGGWLVPLAAHLTMADVARRLRLPVMVVARPGLGTLNHTLLTLRELRRSGLPVIGFVVNEAVAVPRDRLSRVIARTNAETLRRVAGVPYLGWLPHHAQWHRGRWTPASLASWVARHLDRRCFAALTP